MKGGKAMDRRKDNNIQVIKAEDRKVEIRVLDIHFVFIYDGQAVRIVSKYKPHHAQVCDPAALRVPAGLFNKACRQAIQILKERHQRQNLGQKMKEAEDNQKELQFLR